MTFNQETSSLYTVGDDKLIKQWKTEAVDGSDLKAPINTILTKSMLTGVSHHRSKPYLATCGEACNLWEQTRAQPIKTFQWGVDSLQCIKFNQVEENIISKMFSYLIFFWQIEFYCYPFRCLWKRSQHHLVWHERICPSEKSHPEDAKQFDLLESYGSFCFYGCQWRLQVCLFVLYFQHSRPDAISCPPLI